MTAIKLFRERLRFLSKSSNPRCCFLGSVAVKSPFLIFIPLLISSIGHSQQTIPLKGFVQTLKGRQPVAFAEVGIHGIQFKTTSKQGDFTLDIPQQMKVGHVVTFQVSGWIIMQPAYNGVNGSTPLPAPDAGDIIVLVVKRGEKSELLSDSGIRTMLLGSTYHFRRLLALKGVASPKPASLKLFAQQAFQSELARAYFKDWLELLSQQIGIDHDDINSAIELWSKRATSSVDHALASLYKGDLNRAIAELNAAETDQNTSKQEVVLEQALGFTYALQGNYMAAEEVLRKGFNKTGNSDHNFLLHLSNVLLLDGKTQEAQEVFSQARKILQDNGIPLSNNLSSSAPTPDKKPSNPHVYRAEAVGRWNTTASGEDFCLEVESQEYDPFTDRDLIKCKYRHVCSQSPSQECIGEITYDKEYKSPTEGHKVTIILADGTRMVGSIGSRFYPTLTLAGLNGMSHHRLVPEIDIAEARKLLGNPVILCGEFVSFIVTRPHAGPGSANIVATLKDRGISFLLLILDPRNNLKEFVEQRFQDHRVCILGHVQNAPMSASPSLSIEIVTYDINTIAIKDGNEKKKP